MQPTSASDAQVKIRLNREVRDELKVAAAINRRTLMREIEFRVMQSLAKERAQPQGAQQ
ncbi:Arc family DNA-binding protein [Acidovorax sp. RAC01]|uniref:Arc family DNA-binding protein n=1 Tax=Acidovorax sp. RAC01 TaxID=1842533 RepID=UPI0008554F64|nr:Arc family DNA-binding protein [Acidovorax sp. RAC01]AOG21657.1 arc-like DNA binding domain protein [Acidovorax sp. RAC01]AOG22979.1 arc-like DNA binding domain protein [Acidovorax sp. RAC01]